MQNNLSLVKTERGSDRFDTELPIEINGTHGVTRNISASGVYIETDAAQAPGSRVQFTVEMMVAGQMVRMVCTGEVVRVDQKGGTVGIAAKLDSSFFTNFDTQLSLLDVE